MVPKSNGSWRPCGDFSRLNDVTTPDRYPIPHIQDFPENLSGSTIQDQLDRRYFRVFGWHSSSQPFEVRTSNPAPPNFRAPTTLRATY